MCLPAQFPGFKDVTYELESKPWFKRLRLTMLRAQDLNSSTQEEEANRSLGGQPGLYSQTLLQNNNKPLSLYCILTGHSAQLVLEERSVSSHLGRTFVVLFREYFILFLGFFLFVLYISHLFGIFYLHLLMCVAGRACHDTCVEVKEQVVGACSLLPTCRS